MTNNKNYYSEKLSSCRLQRCYEIAPPRVQRYLEAEIDHVANHIRPRDNVLELGCGYGRVIEKLCRKAHQVYGIDTSISSLKMTRRITSKTTNCHFLAMDAIAPGFKNDTFDVVVCIQNGISAFKINQTDLIAQSIRITRPGGIALFSSYSDKFWPDRLNWFELQAQEGLLGEIDFDKTGSGIIVCRDGFKATTFSPDDFISITSRLHLKASIIEIDESSIFCEIVVS